MGAPAAFRIQGLPRYLEIVRGKGKRLSSERLPPAVEHLADEGFPHGNPHHILFQPEGCTSLPESQSAIENLDHHQIILNLEHLPGAASLGSFDGNELPISHIPHMVHKDQRPRNSPDRAVSPPIEGF